MKISEVQEEVIAAIEKAKRKVCEATGLHPSAVELGLTTGAPFSGTCWFGRIPCDGEKLGCHADHLDDLVYHLTCLHDSENGPRAEALKKLQHDASKWGFTIKGVA